MKIEIFHRHESNQAQGLCVVIDVLRAFTTAAFAFAAGVKEIILVATAEEAFQLQRENQHFILMGEEGGLPIKGFDYGNSPHDLLKKDLKGKTIVHRTSEGTQGVVGCRHADQLLIASFVVAEATFLRIRELAPLQVSFIATGFKNGDEDLALAEYLRSKLLNEKVSPAPFLKRVRASPAGRKFADPAIPEFSSDDLELAVQIDRFPFSMEVEKRQGLLIAKSLTSHAL